MLHPDYPFWSFIGFVAVILPIPWHWRARNVATVALIFWVALANLVIFVNTLVWADNYADLAPAWCDVSGRILQIIPYAVPACSLAQMRRLEAVASTRRSVISATERTRRMWLEAALCFAFPLLMLPLLYVVQGHRYDVVESIGCSIPTYISWPGIVIRFVVPLVMSVASMMYAALAVRWFLVRRMQFRAILASSETGLSVSRYLRLIALALCDITVLISQDVIGITTSVSDQQIEPYVSWNTVHDQFNHISQFPEALIPSVGNFAYVFGLYVGPLYSIIFFVFFGLGEEAVIEYIGAYEKVLALLVRLGLRKPSVQKPEAARIPTFGSKAISPNGRPINTDHERTSVVLDDKSEIFHAGHDVESQSSGGKGIPIMVERSVV